MTQEEKTRWAAACLRQKQAELGRLPRKEDFDAPTRSRIKAFLGPWPRALEAAGLKPARKPRAERTHRHKRRPSDTRDESREKHDREESSCNKTE